MKKAAILSLNPARDKHPDSKANYQIIAAVAAAIVGTAPHAHAQAAPAANNPPLEEIIVTGIRGSIQSAIAQKEKSNDIIETISAEDLGKLPDLSIADSLARVPGLAAQRSDGRSNYISIRGFAADFSGTTLSGREQASTGENRGVEFDQFPAELINAVQIYKTPDASLIGQGLAGTVNLETIKPLSAKGFMMAANARGEHNSNGDLNPGRGIGTSGNRLSFSVVDQFMDHTLGVAFGVARLDSPVQEKQYQAWWWGINNGPPGSNSFQGQGWSGPVPGDPDLAMTQEGMQVRAKSMSQIRDGLMGVLEWAPNDRFHSQLDLFYSKYSEETALNGLQWSSSPWDGISYGSANTTANGNYQVVTSGTLNGIKPIMQNLYNDTETRSLSVGWNNRIELPKNWTLIGDLSYSDARDNVRDAYTFTGAKSVVVDNIGFNIPPTGGYPTFSVPINLADPTLVGFTDPDAYSYDGREEWDRQTDTIKAIRLDLTHPVGGWFKSVDFGVDYSDRKKVKSATVYFASLNGNGCNSTDPAIQAACGPYVNTTYAAVNSSLLLSPTSLSYAGIPGIINYNVLNAIASQMYLVPNQGTNDYNRNYYVEEKVPVVYVKFDIDTAMGSVPLRGNIGVQWVHTNQSSNAILTDPSSGQPTGTASGRASYDEFLPSLNLVADFGKRTYLRVGAAKSMMRGRIDDEKAASSASVAQTGPALWSGSGGNPNLKPYIAIGEDISFEKMFGKASYFSLALFNKNLTRYIYSQDVTNFDFSGFVSTGRQPISNIGSFTTPQNGSGGKIQGYELSLTLDGSLLSSALDGFGMQSSYAYTSNYVPADLLSKVPNSPTTFPGFSKDVAALTLYYEKHGLSVRVAETYRSEFTGEIIANFDQVGYTQIKAEKTVNFQAGYEMQGGKAKGLSVLLQVNNLTNTPYRTVQIFSATNGDKATLPLEND
ncbi:MAG: TonB-dependent receptor, partial [Gammaproteobacteria bacterium]|nr:TonB-dependent receptor [Gammaproteobacteria bacterium]